MPILENINFSISMNSVLRSQGADPKIIRERKPILLDYAKNAKEIGKPLLEPKILFQEFAIEKVGHERITLSNGKYLKGQLISQHLSGAEKVLVILLTVGDKIENKINEIIFSDPVLGMALEAVGSASTEALANETCNYFDKEALNNNLETTIPLSPGMVGWSLENGQAEIFDLLDASEIGVELTTSSLMFPRKTLSLVIGVGKDLENHGDMCSYCAMNKNCQYKEHYSEKVS